MANVNLIAQHRKQGRGVKNEKRRETETKTKTKTQRNRGKKQMLAAMWKLR